MRARGRPHHRARRAAIVLMGIVLGAPPPVAAAAPSAGAGERHPGVRTAARPAVPPAEGRPAALREIAITQRLDHQIPLDLPFRDERGRAVMLGDYFGGRPVVLALVYYECPMLCTLVLNGLTRALRVLPLAVGTDFDIVTVSFDPRETPVLAAEKKAAYVADLGRPEAADGWHFLTGDATAIERLAGAVGFDYAWVPEEQQFAHAAAIMVATPEGRLARYFYGVEYAPRDLRLGLVEAADGRIGSPIDQVLLYCYRYDPTTGRYGAVVMNMVRLGGVATLLALGGFMVVALRRERGRR